MKPNKAQIKHPFHEGNGVCEGCGQLKYFIRTITEDIAEEYPEFKEYLGTDICNICAYEISPTLRAANEQAMQNDPMIAQLAATMGVPVEALIAEMLRSED